MIVLDVILGVVMRVSLSMVPDQELIRESSVRLATMAVSGRSSRALVLEVLHQVSGIVLQVNNPSLANLKLMGINQSGVVTLIELMRIEIGGIPMNTKTRRGKRLLRTT